MRSAFVIAGAIALGGGAAVLVFGAEQPDVAPAAVEAGPRAARGSPPRHSGQPAGDGLATARLQSPPGGEAASPERGAPDRSAPPGVDLAQIGAPGPWRAGARDASGARLSRLGDRDRGPDTGPPATKSRPRARGGTVGDGVDDAFRAMGVAQPPGHDLMPGLDQPVGSSAQAAPHQAADTAAGPVRRPSPAADSG